MKKILILLVMFVSNVLFADGVIDSSKNSKEQDLIAKLTNGKYSEKSDGVKELSEAEMKKVVGGYITSTPYLVYSLGGGFSTIQEAAVLVGLSQKEIDMKVACLLSSSCYDTYTNRNRYNSFSSLANNNIGEYVGVNMVMSNVGGRISYTTGAAVYRLGSNGTLTKIRTISTNDSIVFDALSRNKNALTMKLLR